MKKRAFWLTAPGMAVALPGPNGAGKASVRGRPPGPQAGNTDVICL